MVFLQNEGLLWDRMQESEWNVLQYADFIE